MTAGHAGPAGPAGRGPGGADTAGVPWHGRDLTANPFAGDDGAADEDLLALLRARALGQADDADVVAALPGRRVLVPVLAAEGDADPAPPGALRADTSAEMALPLLGGPDGRTALPVFTSAAALGAWQAGARPVPVEARRAALAAVDEGCSALVVDPGSDHAATVRRPALWALAQGHAWLPGHRDPEVAAAVTGALSGLGGVTEVRLDTGPEADLVVEVTVRGSAGDRAGLSARIGAALAGLDLLAERVDGVHVRLRAAPM